MAEQRYCHEYNRKQWASTFLGNRRQRFYKCSDCKDGEQHRVYMTTKAARRNAGQFPCRQCHASNRNSTLEGIVHDVLKKGFSHLPYVCECVSLRGFSGQIDFTLLDVRMLIQVDGPMHFERVGWSKAAGVVQQDVDERCNDRALAQGFHMLRIHHADLNMSEGLIREVLQFIDEFEARLEAPAMSSSVTWSPSYHRSRVERVIHVALH